MGKRLYFVLSFAFIMFFNSSMLYAVPRSSAHRAGIATVRMLIGSMEVSVAILFTVMAFLIFQEGEKDSTATYNTLTVSGGFSSFASAVHGCINIVHGLQDCCRTETEYDRFIRTNYDV